jgi:hypothetical protein
MMISEGFRPSIVMARRILLVVSAVSLAAACGGGKSYNSLDPAASSLGDATSIPNPPTSASAVKVYISPGLTPNFDPSIHDYAINCVSNPEVQFTAQMPESNFALYVPGDSPNRPLSYPINSFQRTFSLAPGQRFRFVIGVGTEEYSVRCLPSDFPPLSVSANGTREAEYYLFAPTLSFSLPANVKQSSYVIITDANGTPVWWKSEPLGEAIDAKILGPDQITWTLQNNGPVAQYVIRNFAGERINTIGSDLNDHDLQPTPSGTFLAIHDVQRICPPDCADMSPWGGSAQMGPLDQEIVELDQQSNVLWTWRTRDHIALVESGEGGFFPGVGVDIIHMNAVEPDGADGVLFSARHLSAIYRIVKSTGAIDWKVGGTPRAESLVVMGDTRPTTMGVNGIALSGQHDVRKWPDGTVSVHDNGTMANRPPSIVRFQIDPAAKTAQVVEQIQDMIDAASICCGSARRLPGGHWLVQWGGIPYMSELDSRGNSVLTINYNAGPQFSYRAIPILPGVVSAEVLREGMDVMSFN